MVQIDNMEMPKNCFDCNLTYECCRCAITGTKYFEDEQFNPSEERLSDCPLREVQPRKTADWVYGEKDGADGWYCSKCGFHIPWYYDYYGLDNINFIRDFHTCPHCDAKMLKYTGMKGKWDETSGL